MRSIEFTFFRSLLSCFHCLDCLQFFFLIFFIYYMFSYVPILNYPKNDCLNDFSGYSQIIICVQNKRILHYKWTWAKNDLKRNIFFIFTFWLVWSFDLIRVKPKKSTLLCKIWHTRTKNTFIWIESIKMLWIFDWSHRTKWSDFWVLLFLLSFKSIFILSSILSSKPVNIYLFGFYFYCFWLFYFFSGKLAHISKRITKRSFQMSKQTRFKTMKENQKLLCEFYLKPNGYL